MGGISTSIKDKWKDATVNVSQGIDEDEYFVIRLEHFSQEEVEARWAQKEN